MTRIHFALLILSSAVLALRCVPADPTPVIDHTATAKHERHIVPCDECNGTGQVEYDGSVPYLPKGKYRCPICGGDGTLIHEGPVYKRCDNPACKCDPCKCDPCKCKDPQPEPTLAPKIHAYMVVICRNPECKRGHRDAVRRVEPQIKELLDKGWGPYLTVLCEGDPADVPKIRELNVHADTTPYIAVERDGKVVGGRFVNSAKDAGEWMNTFFAQASADSRGDGADSREPVAETHSAPALSSLLTAIVVSGGDRCPPCRVMKRDQAEIEAEIGVSLTVLMDDADSGERTGDGKPKTVAQKYRVDAVPTTIVLMDGKEIDRTTGYSGKRGFCRWLKGVAEKHGGRWK